MTRQIRVHVCIADPIAGQAVRKLLAANPKVRLTPWRAEHVAQGSFAEGLGSGFTDGELLADVDVLLLGPEDLIRFDEHEPGRIDEFQRRVRILLLLRSEELPDALELLRHCDGMIVRDVNIANISAIIEFALHGYFVIPYNLITNFQIASPLTHAVTLEQISSRENGVATINGRNISRDISTKEFCATRRTMRRAISNVLRQRKSGARAQMNAAATARAAEATNTDIAKGDSEGLARWRRALRDDDGRVSAAEYVLLFAAIAIWGAIIFDGGAVVKFGKSLGFCTSVASSAQCGIIARAPESSAAAGLTSAAKKPQATEKALRTSVDNAKDLE